MAKEELYRLSDNEDEDHWDNFGEDYDEDEEREKKCVEIEKDEEDYDEDWD